MKRINSKGFAISSLIYGLSIMGFLIVTLLISIMSNNRNNTKSFVEEIESDLNRFSLTETTIAALSSGSTAQEYIVPKGESGWYKIELWGASGGDKGSHTGGRGAYTSGVIYLEENTHLYFYIGKSAIGSQAGANGGLASTTSTTAGGGGATDVRIKSGTWNSSTSYNSRIMVAAGGGGATTSSNGGMGGDIKGITPTGTAGSATQTAGSIFSTPSYKNGSGGGYRIATSSTNGEGGSSYISGYAGCTRYNSSYYFKNGFMVPGTNKGDGKASIKKVDTNLTEKLAMNDIVEVTDCIYDKRDITFTDIQLMQNGINILQSGYSNPTVRFSNSTYNTDAKRVIDNNLTTSFSLSSSSASTENCVTVSLGKAYNLDEVAVWHAAYEDTVKHELTLKKSNNTTLTLSEPNRYEMNEVHIAKETTNGLHYSAYRSNSSTIQNGTYYIFAAENPSYVFTAGSYPFTAVEQINNNSSLDQTTKDINIFNTATTSTVVNLAGITGSKYQKWYIESLGSNYYKISEIQNYNVLQLQEGSNAIGEKISTPTSYTDNEEEKWKITAVGNNLYTIESALAGNNRIINSNNTLLMTNKSNTTLATKFLLVNIDY